MDAVKAKILHHSLNLDYQQNGISAENQVNQFINYIMNSFLLKFHEEDFKTKYFVLEFQNDMLSLITYNMLKALQSVYNFQILIYGKHSQLNSYIKRYKNHKNKERTINIFTFNRLKKENRMVLISCYNPIYQVVNITKKFNKFDLCFNFIERMTQKEIFIAKDFYDIELSKTDEAIFQNTLVCDFQSFCDGENASLFNWKNESLSIPKEIHIVKLTNDNESNNELLNDIVKTQDMVFYECDEDLLKYPILFSDFQFYLKNKSNIAGYWNVNAYSIVQTLIRDYNVKVIYHGEVNQQRWTNEN